MTNRGVALLEALVALAILALAGTATVGLIAAGLRNERDARSRETTLSAEERLLAATTLLRRTELDRRIGRHPVGEFLLDVQRPEPTLYRIGLLQATAPHVEDLVTVVYRADPR